MKAITFNKLALVKVPAERQAEEHKCKRWRAKKGGVFHYVSDKGSIGCMADPKSVFADANGFYQKGNYFRTETEAQRALERMIATQQLKDRITELNAQQGWMADWSDENQDKFFPSFDYLRKELCSKASWTAYVAPSEFACSHETLVKIKEEMPEQIKLWLGVEQ